MAGVALPGSAKVLGQTIEHLLAPLFDQLGHLRQPARKPGRAAAEQGISSPLGLPLHAEEIGVHPALMQLTADRGPTDVAIALQHQYAKSCLRQVGGVGEAIVACTDNDRVVVGH